MTRDLKIKLSGLLIAAFVILTDQLSKWFIVSRYFAGADQRGFGAWLTEKATQAEFAPVKLTGFLDAVLVWNPGVSFGLLQTNRQAVFYGLTALALVVALGFLIWLWREPKPWRAVAIGLIVGGALGNVWDRLRFGAVVDFIDFHIAGYHWPAFNIADAGVTLGIALILVETVFFPASRTQADRSAA